MTSYYKYFLAKTQVIEKKWGQFVPTGMVASAGTDADKKIACDKLLAMIFLARADKARFAKLKDTLNNAYLAGTDNYPTSIDGSNRILKLLSHYQDHQGSALHMDGNRNSMETSFAQHGVQ